MSDEVFWKPLSVHLDEKLTRIPEISRWQNNRIFGAVSDFQQSQKKCIQTLVSQEIFSCVKYILGLQLFWEVLGTRTSIMIIKHKIVQMLFISQKQIFDLRILVNFSMSKWFFFYLNANFLGFFQDKDIAETKAMPNRAGP